MVREARKKIRGQTLGGPKAGPAFKVGGVSRTRKTGAPRNSLDYSRGVLAQERDTLSYPPLVLWSSCSVSCIFLMNKGYYFFIFNLSYDGGPYVPPQSVFYFFTRNLSP